MQEKRPCKRAPLADCPYNAASCSTSCAERYHEFILAVAERVKEVVNGGIVYWQRDTEPTSPFPHYPADAPEEYAELQRIFYKAVKSVFPDAIVIGCNQNGSFTSSGEPVNAAFFDYFLKNARDWFDVLDVRPYGDVYTIPARVAWFRDRMHRYGTTNRLYQPNREPNPRVLMQKSGRSLFAMLLARAMFACSKANIKSRWTCFQ